MTRSKEVDELNRMYGKSRARRDIEVILRGLLAVAVVLGVVGAAVFIITLAVMVGSEAARIVIEGMLP